MDFPARLYIPDSAGSRRAVVKVNLPSGENPYTQRPTVPVNVRDGWPVCASQSVRVPKGLSTSFVSTPCRPVQRRHRR